MSRGPVSLIMEASLGGGVTGVPVSHVSLPGLRRARTHTRQPPRGCRRVGVPPKPPSPDLPALHFLQVRGTHGVRDTHGGGTHGGGYPLGDPGGDTHAGDSDGRFGGGTEMGSTEMGGT